MWLIFTENGFNFKWFCLLRAARDKISFYMINDTPLKSKKMLLQKTYLKIYRSFEVRITSLYIRMISKASEVLTGG
jgi:hypothetical protein